MKKLFLTFASLCLVVSVYSCRETDKKAEDAADSVEEVMEDAGDAVEEAMDDAGDAIEEAVDEAVDTIDGN